MTNGGVYGFVNFAVYRVVFQAVYRAVYVSVNVAVHVAEFVPRAVFRAVYRAAGEGGAISQREEPPHPGLGLYLGAVT